MDQDNFNEFKEDFALFIETGFIAVKQLDEVSATRLFKAADVLNPGNPSSQLGLGYIALNKLEVKEASKIFSALLEEHPQHYLAQSLLGICYLLTKSKKKKGEELILDAKEKSEDPTIKNLANVALTWAEKDLNKKDVFSILAGSSQEGKGE